MQSSANSEQSDAPTHGHWSIIVSLIGWIITLAIGFLPILESVPVWARYVLLIIIAVLLLVTLVLGAIPASKLVRSWVSLRKIQRQKGRHLGELAELVIEARFLFNPDLTFSLLGYVNKVCTAVVQDNSLHTNIKRLAERLQVLEHWQLSLRTFANVGLCRKAPFPSVVLYVSTLYRDTANVVRELANMSIPEAYGVQVNSDYRRMMEGKYNDHIGRVEQLLGRIAKLYPEIPTEAFYRFGSR